MAQQTLHSFRWRPCWSTRATRATWRSGSPTPSVSSTTPLRSGSVPTSRVNVSCDVLNNHKIWQSLPMRHFSAITCGEPEDIPAGILERKCQTFGCRISYTCEPGYQLVGRSHRYCQADGSWSPQLLPECKREFIHLLFWRGSHNHKYVITAVSCPTPSHPSFGRVMFNSVTYNSLISYECNYGYMIIGKVLLLH